MPLHGSPIASVTLVLPLLGCLAGVFPAAAEDAQPMPPGRTGAGGAGQAANPGGQHPGQVGAIPLPKAAVFDIQLTDMGTPASKADRDRLPHLSDALRKELALQNLFDVVAVTPAIKDQVGKQQSLRACNGCGADYAKELGARVAITSELSKVSNAVVSLNVYVQDVEGDRSERKFSTSFGGVDDGSLNHAVRYVVDKVMRPQLAQSGAR